MKRRRPSISERGHMSFVVRLTEALVGQKPDRYDWRDYPEAVPSQREREDVGVHAELDAIRFININRTLAQIRIDRYHDRKLIVATLVSNLMLVAMMLAALVSGANSIPDVIRQVLHP